ncbi:MAG TPA: hypothetical protein VN796_07855 [Acidimicrobiales bacterium]|nr:hypothetical protein [Acidimicrobiales bacterium]
MQQRLARTLQSQQEESRTRMQAVMRRGGWSVKAADRVMERIPPDPNAPTTEEGALVLAYPWMARLSESQRARCISDLSDAAGAIENDPPDSAELGAMARVFAYWREKAEG